MTKRSGSDALSRAPLLVAFLLLLLSAPDPLRAQSGLEIVRIENLFPQIKVFVRTYCNKQIRLDIAAKDITIRENGALLPGATIDCPNVPVPCCISAGIIFDRSGSMAGKKIRDAQDAAIAFVDGMNGHCDEASLTSFDAAYRIDQEMTVSKSLLIQAINNLQAGGGTAVWDASIAGIQELYEHGSGGCKTAILLTDGEDNASAHTLDDVIAYAKNVGIKVMVIGLQVDGAYQAALERLASETGGTYYPAASSAALKDIFLAIKGLLTFPLPECEIDYFSSCPDGTLRTVTVGVEACGSHFTADVQYRAPLDTGRSFESATVRVGSDAVEALHEVLIPVRVETIASNPVPPSRISLEFSPSCMQLTGIETGGTLLQDATLAWKSTPSGAEIRIDRNIPFTRPDVLMYLRFTAGDPAMDIDCPISIADWDLGGAGCVRILPYPGMLHVFARKPVVDCRIDMPAELQWDRGSKDYDTNPFQAAVILRNVGNREARNPRTTISFDTTAFQLVNPATPTVAAQPAIIPRDIGEAVAAWDIRARFRTRTDTLTICAVTTFDNHPPVECCARIVIPPAQPVLHCSVSAPPIQADVKTNSYTPMPFDVTVTIENRGGLPTDTVRAFIELPADFSLAGADSGRFLKRSNPALLAPGKAAQITWSVRHPVAVESSTSYISVCTYTAASDTTCCYAEVVIPALSVPLLNCSIAMPDSVAYDDSLDTYVPMIIPITVGVVNNGVLDADSASATLRLPPELELYPSNQPLTKFFSPRRIVRWSPQLPPNELTWTARAKPLADRACPAVSFTISGYDPVGRRYNETSCAKTICIPPHFITPMICFISAPDTLPEDPTGTAYVPNPVQVWCTVKNTGRRRLDSVRTTLLLPTNMGISFVTGETPTKLAAPFIDPGNTMDVGWMIRASEKAVPRAASLRARTSAINRSVADSWCVWETYLPPLKVALSCAAAAPDTIRYDKSSDSYTPDPFTALLQLSNNSGADIRTIDCTLELPPELALAAGDSLPRLVPSIPAGKDASVAWRVALARHLTAPALVTLIFKYAPAGGDTSTCPVQIVIEPANRPILECSLIAPDSVRLGRSGYVPDLFDIQVRVANRGTLVATGIRAYLLGAAGLQLLSPADQPVAPAIAPGDTAEALFRVRTLGGSSGAADSLRVLLTADASPPSFCGKSIWIDGREDPRFQLECAAGADSVVYDRLNRSYVPDPLQVSVRVRNGGTSDRFALSLVCLASRGFILDQPASARMNLPAIAPSRDTVTLWSVRALRRPASGVDTLRFQLEIRSLLTGAVSLAECSLPIRVGAAHDLVYAVQCSAPASLQYQDSLFSPNSFRFSGLILNQSQNDGRNVSARVTLPAGLRLAPGEQATIPLGDLPAGNSIPVAWQVTADRTIPGDTVTLCLSVSDADGESAGCCAPIALLRPGASPLRLTCGAPDSLAADYAAAVYRGNPFVLTARISNAAGREIDSLYAQAIPLTPNVRLADPSKAVVALPQPLQPGDTAAVQWLMEALPQSADASCAARVIAWGVSAAAVDCIARTALPRLFADSVEITCATDPPDTLRFDASAGDYLPNPFVAQATIRNDDRPAMKNVKARITLPPDISLEDGETAEKRAIPPDLATGVSATLSWKLRARRVSTGSLRQIRIDASSDNSASRSCASSLFLEGTALAADLEIPPLTFGRDGKEIVVPVFIRRAEGKGIAAYAFTLDWDSTILLFKEARAQMTLTGNGWRGPRTAEAAGGHIAISDFTTGYPLRSDTGALVRIVFVGNAPQASAEPVFVSTLLSLGRPLLNSGEVAAQPAEGKVFVSGNCLAPLQSAKQIVLLPNKPNPFNPRTAIGFVIPEESRVRLTVYDPLGSKAALLLDERRPAGAYEATFDAGALRSGLYFCRLEACGQTRLIKMIYQK